MTTCVTVMDKLNHGINNIVIFDNHLWMKQSMQLINEKSYSPTNYDKINFSIQIDIRRILLNKSHWIKISKKEW